MQLKTKLTLSLLFLFLVILIFGILGIFYINRLSKDADVVLKNNHESLVYCNNMLRALEDIGAKANAAKLFDNNLKKQENNITETGEKDATIQLRKNFNELIAAPSDPSNYSEIRQSIYVINDLNQQAILRKNAVAKGTAQDAILWMSLVFTVLTLISLTLVVNLPWIISNPVHALSEGINEIANKNYRKRIFIKQRDEFGELANAFNKMAEKLDEYESSSLAKIKFEKSRIETIINQMNDGIIGLDEKRKVLFLNGVAENLIGIKEKDITGKYAPDVALKNDLMRAILQDESKKDLKIYADNKESYFNKDILNVKNNEEVIGQVIVLRNITAFHELNEAKTNFIATVSHELKTPISSIKMSAQLLTDSRVGVINDEQTQLIKSITDDAERLLKLTSELLDMTQVETGKMHLTIKPINVKEIISYAVEATKSQAEQSNVALEINCPDNIPPINADREKTAWVLTNLILNAVHYSYENSSVRIMVKQVNDQIEFSVQDFGRGIESRYQGKVFDRYFQVPGISKTGTGLGLTISKEFIEAQGGEIKLETEIGKGSIFSFTLNIA